MFQSHSTSSSADTYNANIRDHLKALLLFDMVHQPHCDHPNFSFNLITCPWCFRFNRNIHKPLQTPSYKTYKLNKHVNNTLMSHRARKELILIQFIFVPSHFITWSKKNPKTLWFGSKKN